MAIAEDTGGSTRGPAAVSSLVGLRPSAAREPARHVAGKTIDGHIGADRSQCQRRRLLLDVIAGYDPKDPVTAQAVGQIPKSYTSFLAPDGLRGRGLA